jgi:colicin import membrane protein
MKIFVPKSKDFCTFAPINNKNDKMKKFLIALLTLMPMLATAQDNTWERIEVEEQPKESPDAKYLVPNAVPEVDGQVVFQTTIAAEGKSADEIYDILLKQLTKMVAEPNQISNSAVVIQDPVKHELGATFHEWLVFKNASLSLDRTQFNFLLHVDITDGQADVSMMRISYDYDLERRGAHYTAEKWITDKYAVNKKHTKLYPLSAKFRRKTIDRKDFIFQKFNSLLNENK